MEHVCPVEIINKIQGRTSTVEQLDTTTTTSTTSSTTTAKTEPPFVNIGGYFTIICIISDTNTDDVNNKNQEESVQVLVRVYTQQH